MNLLDLMDIHAAAMGIEPPGLPELLRDGRKPEPRRPTSKELQRLAKLAAKYGYVTAVETDRRS